MGCCDDEVLPVLLKPGCACCINIDGVDTLVYGWQNADTKEIQFFNVETGLPVDLSAATVLPCSSGGGGVVALAGSDVDYIARTTSLPDYSVGQRIRKVFIYNPAAPLFTSALCLNASTGVPIAVPPLGALEGTPPRLSVIASGWLEVGDGAVVDLTDVTTDKGGGTPLAIPTDAVGAFLQAQIGGTNRLIVRNGGAPSNAPTIEGKLVNGGGVVNLGITPYRGDVLGAVTELATFAAIAENAPAGNTVGFDIDYFELG